MRCMVNNIFLLRIIGIGLKKILKDFSIFDNLKKYCLESGLKLIRLNAESDLKMKMLLKIKQF